MAKKSEGARRPSPDQEQKTSPPTSKLVTMVKDGHIPIMVHPRQIEPWRRQGWKIEE